MAVFAEKTKFSREELRNPQYLVSPALCIFHVLWAILRHFEGSAEVQFAVKVLAMGFSPSKQG